ncbi:MAG: agmatinase [Woeseiaceae bacterium]|nr:agmatinase [Woeseiaceae bacterium]NIP22038.1 agmatinase [Woeseiaceae bacterium]NIS91162.1 agmatinase [Woeseiaceae bacterium]
MTKKRGGDHAILREDLYGTTPEPTYAGALSFMRRKYTRDLTGVDVVVTGIPLDTATTNRPGARLGPRAIRAASSMLAWERPYGMPFDPFEKLAVVDYGDCFFDFGRPDQVPDAIEQHASEIIGQGPALLSLGGDHFVSFPLLKAHAKKHGAPLSLIHFDAHSDTWADEDDRIDHGTMFFHAAKQGLVDPTTSVQIGLRTTNHDTLGFSVLDAPWVHQNGIAAVIDKTRTVVGDRPAYLTFDIDCLDPSCAPGTGTPVCGGLTSHQALEILRGLAGTNVVGMDVVEVAPSYDVGEITALAATSLAMEMLYLYACRPGA